MCGLAAAAIALQDHFTVAALGGKVVLLIEAFPVRILLEIVDLVDMGQPDGGMIAHADKAGRVDNEEVPAR